jgi:hypothetical protein
MFKEVMNDLWLARISSLSNEVGLCNWKHNFKIIMDAVEDYARRWIKREVDQDPELESLSDWVRTLRSKTIKSFLVFKYRLRSTINTILEFVNPTLYKRPKCSNPV